ncbi:MAG TPA: hypothetical protein VFI31_19015 [Pirellulales bacterium]|nr:hypothetical protein [Pirellulales bacterium]
MASSENQGLQIALIIFVMLTILLSVTTFMFFREYQEADERSRVDKGAATDAQKQMRDAVTEMEKVKEFIGVSPQAKLDDVRQTLDEDMKKYAATAPDESKFYHPALEFLFKTLEERTSELVAARLTIQQEKDEREKVENAKQEQVAAAEEHARKAEADLAEAKKEFDAERKRMLDDNEDLKKQLAKKNEDMSQLAETSKKTEEDLKGENKKLSTANVYLTEKIDVLDPTTGFEVPDGKIVWVDQQSRSAYINVGQSDGLKRQTMFSVLAGDEDVGDDQKTKGRIEVTEILGPHFAEARILEDRMTDPLVQGDKIYTPLWQPGRTDGFGIIGFIDMDGDGSDDRDMLRDLIRLNGGRIDAEDTKDGKQIGELNVNTRYLIVGEPPQDAAVLSKAFTTLGRDAQKLGVRPTSVSKFLDQMGWRNQQQTLVFGRHGNGGEIPPERRDGGPGQSTGSVSGAFKVRRPLGRRGLSGMDAEGSAPQKPRSAYGK